MNMRQQVFNTWRSPLLVSLLSLLLSGCNLVLIERAVVEVGEELQIPTPLSELPATIPELPSYRRFPDREGAAI